MTAAVVASATDATIVVRDEHGSVVLRLDPEDLVTLWADPEVLPADDEWTVAPLP